MKLLKTVALSASLLLSSTVFADSVVVVNAANGDAITPDIAKSIFLGKQKKMPSGGPATPVVIDASDAAYADFAQSTLGKNPAQLKSYWAQRIFTGKGKPPAEKGSAKAVLDFVAGNSGAIAVMDSSQVDDSVKVAFSL